MDAGRGCHARAGAMADDGGWRWRVVEALAVRRQTAHSTRFAKRAVDSPPWGGLVSTNRTVARFAVVPLPPASPD